MREFGFHPVDQIPVELKDAATLEMSHFTVSLIVQQQLIGSLHRRTSQFFRHIAEGEVDECAHAGGQETMSGIDDVNR
jgi:hypothetical protein